MAEIQRVCVSLFLSKYVLTSLGVALTVCWAVFIGISKYGGLPSDVVKVLAHPTLYLFPEKNRSHSKTTEDSGQPLDSICHSVLPQKGIYTLLRPYSHRPEVVARAIIEFNAQPTTKDQYLATKEYERLLRCMNRLPEDVELLHEFLKVFDRLFFFGALTEFCFLEVVPEEDGVLGEAFGARPEYYGNGKVRKPFQAKIEIHNRADDFEVQDPQEQLLAYVETLLHERIHAMFIVYVCLAKHECQERQWQALGNSGHLTAWQDAALVVERASVHLYPRGLSLNRERSYWQEIVYSGRPLTDSQLEDWGFANCNTDSGSLNSSQQTLVGSVPEETHQGTSREE